MAQREPAPDKAIRAISQGRVAVIKAVAGRGIALRIVSDREGNPRYTTVVYRRKRATIRRCSCPNAIVHPRDPQCWHVWLAERLLSPDTALEGGDT